MSNKKKDYKSEIIEIVEKESDSKKMKLLFQINEMLSILPLWAVQGTKDLLTELYFS